ncbi:hypothetical protein HHK36_015036 [Tetracentron sinense]|uniref:Uncharacterized protein n=1 Tax=Tetracentron sinense TaxID=13715 RepID=A0A834Z8I0_TETSI|nr:hypothetical protein HHK36_015036 [Tetracentron sinense]
MEVDESGHPIQNTDVGPMTATMDSLSIGSGRRDTSSSASYGYGYTDSNYGTQEAQSQSSGFGNMGYGASSYYLVDILLLSNNTLYLPFGYGLNQADAMLQWDLIISCICSLTQIALKLSASIHLDRVFDLINCSRILRNYGNFESKQAEQFCKGIDATLVALEIFRGRGQIKLVAHCHATMSDRIKPNTCGITQPV